MPETNTLQVTLPRGRGLGVDLLRARNVLQAFGDVSHVKVLPETDVVLSVVFFDVRSATAAHIALGDEGCKPLRQTGSRTVSMPDRMQLGVENLRNVSNIRSDPEDENALCVEFYDIRDAQRVRDLVCEMVANRASPSLSTAHPGIELPPGLAPAPDFGLPTAEASSTFKQEKYPGSSPVSDEVANGVRTRQSRRKSGSDKAVMAQFFRTAAGKQLLSEEYGFEYGSSSHAAVFNWEADSDSSDSDASSRTHRKGRSTISDASTADSNSEASDQDVF